MSADWVERRLIADCRVIRTQVDPRSLAAAEVVHYDIPTIQTFQRPSVQAPEEIQSNKFVVAEGDWLVSKFNPRKGCQAIVGADPRPKICSTEFVVLRPRKWDVRFISYLIESPAVRDRLSAVVQSVTKSHQRANPSDIYNLVLSVPGIRTQHANADFLDRKTAAIDALIGKMSGGDANVGAIGQSGGVLGLLREYRQAVITAAVTGKLDVATAQEAA